MATANDATLIPAGTYSVDPAASTLSFRSRGMFGLVPVRGTFTSFTGELTAGEAITGELRIDAASLDTGNARRDTHLRSADFFDVENAPTVTFTLVALTPTADGGATVTGDLQIRDTTLRISAPVQITAAGDRLTLSTELAVDRAAAGVGWSKLGMIQGPAHLAATVVLEA